MDLFVHILIYVISGIVAVWIAGALYFDVAGAASWAWLLSLGWIVTIAMLYGLFPNPWIPFGLLGLMFGLFLAWWFSLPPRQDRNWDSNFACLPRVEIDGDTLTLHNVRNTEYQTPGDHRAHFETRTYRLSQLCGADVVIQYWGSPWMSHPMFIFDFGVDGRLCISIEVRYRVGQVYNFLPSLYRQQELMYVVCDERDAILRRTWGHDRNELYLYRIFRDSITQRLFLFEYFSRINDLADRPRWYNGLTENCTTSIYRQGQGRIRWDWRMVFNGNLDRMMFERGLFDRRLPFEELKQQSRINEIANTSPADEFGYHLRCRLPGYWPKPAGANDRRSSASSNNPQAGRCEPKE